MLDLVEIETEITKMLSFARFLCILSPSHGVVVGAEKSLMQLQLPDGPAEND
jgi:hypothetical protein